MRYLWLHILALLVLFSTPIATQAQEPSDRATILVLDASGSMWAQLPEGRSRIEVARDVLDDFLGARPAVAPLGIIAYGHRRKDDCTDVEVIAPVGPVDNSLTARLRALSPTGKTPIADALRLAATMIPPTAEEADLVLITDGLETCGGDPCAIAAELARSGIPLRAHVVGFGLTEGEVAQIACIADSTGGQVLTTQSGAELSDALLRTAMAEPATSSEPGTAAMNLSIREDIAGRPARVSFRAVHETSGETRDLGLLDFNLADHLATELAEGTWLITADAGPDGNGEITVTVAEGDTRTIYVPFRGLLPSLDMPAPVGAFRAGINGLIPYRISQEGLATGGGDFIFFVLPVDAIGTGDRRLDYATQDSRLGSHVGTFRVPSEPGKYLLAFHRNADMPIADVMERFVIQVTARPDVTLTAPPAVAPGARIPVSVAGGMGNADRIEVWKDGALYSWDQSIYLQDFFDNAYGPAKPLLAPTIPGAYEVVYVFSELDGNAAIAARVPLIVGEVPDLDAAADVNSEAVIVEQAQADQTESAATVDDDVAYSCPADNGVPCFFEDSATGLVFALPPGWLTDFPTREGATAGSQTGPVRIIFFSKAEPVETVVLNPRQWVTTNGPCLEIQPGSLCRFDSDSTEMARAIEVLSRGIHDMGPSAPRSDTPQAVSTEGYGEDAGAARAWSDYPHRCLPDDKTQAICDMRDEATGLTFLLPENWVAEAFALQGAPRADFFEVTGDARSMHLNPATWPTPDSGCFFTRAGRLCTDMALMDDTLNDALNTLRRYITTGQVLRSCGNKPCTYALPWQGFSGRLPARWGVEVGQLAADKTLSSWFFSVTPDFELKLVGLNQAGGENCRTTMQGASLCEHTPYVSAEEVDLIASTVVLPVTQANDAVPIESIPLDPAVIDAITDLLKGD